MFIIRNRSWGLTRCRAHKFVDNCYAERVGTAGKPFVRRPHPIPAAHTHTTTSGNLRGRVTHGGVGTKPRIIAFFKIQLKSFVMATIGCFDLLLPLLLLFLLMRLYCIWRIVLLPKRALQTTTEVDHGPTSQLTDRWRRQRGWFVG